ncbi:MAG: DNA-processing protein DprA [Gammaproteobacteria bacterium]
MDRPPLLPCLLRNFSNEQQRQFLALALTPGFGPQTLSRLAPEVGNIGDIRSLPDSQLQQAGVSAQVIKSLKNPDWAGVDRAQAWAEHPHQHLLTLADSNYPVLLQEIHDPPLLLFVRGELATLSQPQLGIVGSRNPTVSGMETAADFAASLARAGLTISSGLATGIDAAAHQGALQAGHQFKTLAVTGCGLDRVYPQRHRALADDIAANGALVSEFPPGTPPLARHFPRRNRIISGLSLGVLVVEAAQRSGSLITARLALEQNREVFAIPGSIHSPTARGCHALIRQGAKLVETARDITEELVPLLGFQLASQPAAETTEPADLPGPEYAELYALMDDAPSSVDVLVARSGLTADAVSSMLLILELRGLVTSQPGGTYSRLRPR